MLPKLESFYAEWRVRSGVIDVLRDDNDSPPERLLQAIWQHQRLQRDQLKTLDGESVRILHPGFRNVESGPDFHGAVVQVGEGAAQSGDIEVDLRSSGWWAHGHDQNPAFKNVILHVIWENERPVAGAPPVVILRHALDAPLGELCLWLGGESAQVLPEHLRGQCCAPFRNLTPTGLSELLEQAAAVRLRSKAAQFQARARHVGWDQALWEGLFRALGYKHNVWPMQRLAELRALWADGETDAFRLQARLLGLSGLLPADLSRTQAGADSYLRRVWDQWWRERDAFLEVILPKSVWHLHGLRPANHPQRRLALAAGWIRLGNIAARLERWCERELPANRMAAALLEALQVEPDDFWSWHWTLRAGRLSRCQPLLGATRVTDLAMNVVLPWLWIRAVEGRSEAMQQRVEQRYSTWPPAEDNSVLRLARQRLLGDAPRRNLTTAAAQQGLIQIVRDFCDHSNAVCDQCRLPELVKEACATTQSGISEAARTHRNMCRPESAE